MTKKSRLYVKKNRDRHARRKQKRMEACVDAKENNPVASGGIVAGALAGTVLGNISPTVNAAQGQFVQMVSEASLGCLQIEDARTEPQQPPVNASPSPVPAEEQVKTLLVSPKSGILREVQNIMESSESEGENINWSQDFERSSLMDSPSKERRLLSTTPLPEETPCTPCSSTFKVAEMICVSGLLPVGEDSSPLVDTPRHDNSPQEESHLLHRESYFLERVRVEVKSKLPATWEANATDDTLIVRKNSSVDLRGSVVQRSVVVSRDGTVELQMHFSPIHLDHQIWQELPDRAPLNSESVPDFVTYVLKVVDEFRKYDICLGIPEKNYYDVARKMPGTVPDYNEFKESRCHFTFRSESCDLILQVLKKYCPSCSKIRANIRARYRRASVLTGSPHAKTKNSCLYTPVH